MLGIRRVCFQLTNRMPLLMSIARFVSGMTQKEVAHVIRGLDEVLNVFRHNEGKLSARQIRARTMLAIARSEIAQALSDACHDLKAGTELFLEPRQTDETIDTQESA